MTAPESNNVLPLPAVAASSPPSSGEGESKPAKKERKKRELPPNFFDNFNTLVKHFVLIHGTDTAWDGAHEMVIKIAHMRLTYSSEAVKAWLNSPERRMILRDQLVFDPTRTCSRLCVNIYSGLESRPRTGRCGKILELLMHLVGESPEAHDWVLRWCALPLQQPGTKMATAIVMHGAEGTGKNAFWGVLQAIYGRYATMIGQAQIESDFNGWASGKLLVVANEVLGRKEKWELRGALKHMVTEPEIYINEKNMPERVERNHMNLVFLSNEVQPLVLGDGDRRYMVIDCWRNHERGKAFYDEVMDEIRNGGAEAFHAHLLSLPLEGFTAHSKPPDTQAKRDLVELGKDEPERFFDQWDSGMLDLPSGAAAAEDLYQAFRRWCMRQGERHVPSMTRFGRSAKIRYNSDRMRIQVEAFGRFDERQKVVYWGDGAVPDACEKVEGWLRTQVERFRLAVVQQNGGPNGDDGR